MKYFIYRRKSQEAEDRQIMSLESQSDEINRLIASHRDIEIVGNYEESRTAKTPGRPLFDEMMQRIERGEAQGIIAWHPDRLARNSIDGGRVIYALDQGYLQDMKFCSYAFENDPQGKFMLNIIFGYSKYYVDNLSINVKRGMNTKLKNGWKPGLAPIGYKNCKDSRTIVPDKAHFKAIRSMYDLLLSGNHSPSDIHRIVCKQWGYRTPIRKNQGGKNPALSTIYKILSNPFYAGYIRWKGQLHTGKHIPVISKAEYIKVKAILGHTSQPTQKTRNLPYVGVMQCGECGLSITGELKTKPSGKQYTYYHCTRVHKKPKCDQPAISGRELEKAIDRFFENVTLPDPIVNWLQRIIESNQSNGEDAQHEAIQAAKGEIAKIERQLSNLTDLRLREMIDETEFLSKRESLQTELDATQERIQNISKQNEGLEPIKLLAILSNRAKNWHSEATPDTKRRLLKIMSWNPTLNDRKAVLVAKKPFVEIGKLASFP